MRKTIVALCAAAVMALAASSASADTILRVPDPTPTGTFTDGDGNQGYGEIRDDGVRACNENPGTPAGDNLTGYAWVDTGGDANAGHTDDDADPDGVTYGNPTVGAGDYDGEGNGNETDADGDGVVDPEEDTNGNGKFDSDRNDCPA